jgi:uncharacterized protein YjiK
MTAAAHLSSTRRVARAVALGLATAATALVVQPASPAAARALTGVDLSTYHRTARLDLPSSAGPNQLASEASSVTYDWDTDSLFVVGDEGTAVVQVDKDTGALIDSMPLTAGDFEDIEGIAYAGDGQFVITEERLRQVDRFTYVAGTPLTRADVQSAKLGTTVGNIGLEGVTYDRVADDYILVKEKTPESIFATDVDWAGGTATNGSPATDESTDLFTPSAAGLDDFSDVYALADVTGLTGPDADHLLMISQESGKIINISRAGVVSSTLTIRGDADTALSVPDQTMEGVTIDADGTIYVVNEQGGGVDHPQLWAYQPSATPDAAPTAVTLTDPTTTLPDSTSTAARVKVAGVAVTDPDDLGTNDLAVTGPDAADFEVDDTGLHLKAGTALDAATKSTYTVSVTVDDLAAGGTPDATSTPYTLTVTSSNAGGPVSLAVTEVDPTGSGNSTYAADWFELTNTGTTAADLTGFKIDDDTGGAGAAVPMVGVTSLAPGESAVLVEGTATTAAALKTAWFGPDAPAGLQVGSYTGSGVGLGAGGDQVNVYDTGGNPVTGVAFGAATTGVTFDNHAGLGGASGTPPTVTTLSVVGVGGARVAGGETGSPATIAPDVTAPVIAYAGNAGTYTVGDTVHITCAAADEAYGSGLDTTDCVDVDAPASAFAIGQNTITTTATDHAGNVGTGSVTFTVKAAPVDTPSGDGDGGGTGTTPPAVTPPAVTPPAVTPPAVVPPAVIPPAPTPAQPKAAAPTSAKASSLEKGVTTTLTHLKARSKVTLSVRAGGRTVTTIKVTADAKGTGKVKLKLTKRQLAKLHGKTLTLRYTVVGANGRRQTLTTTLKVK